VVVVGATVVVVVGATVVVVDPATDVVVVADGRVVVLVDVPAELLSATSTRARSVRPGSPLSVPPVLVPADWISRYQGSALLGMAKVLDAHGSRAAAVAPDWFATGSVMDRV
jgi:hypothetical protein